MNHPSLQPLLPFINIWPIAFEILGYNFCFLGIGTWQCFLLLIARGDIWLRGLEFDDLITYLDENFKHLVKGFRV
jgi:hypothetical protein